MRACGGVWIAHGSAARRTATRLTRNDRVPVPPDKPAYALRRVWLSDEEQDGYYYGLANEGLVAALPYRLRPPDLPRTGLGALCRGQSALRRRRRRGGGPRRPDRAGAGLSLRLAAAHDSQAPAPRDDHHVLAHSLAQSGNLRHLPLARRDHRRAARQPRSSASIPGSIATIFSRRSTASWKAASTANDTSVTLGGHETLVRSYPISIEWPPAALARQAPVRGVPARGQRAFRPQPDDMRIAVGDRALRLHQGHCRPDAGGRRSAGRTSRVARQVRVLSRRRRRPAANSPPTRPSERGSRGGGGDQRKIWERLRYKPSCSPFATTSRRRCLSFFAPPISASSRACTTA